MPPPNTIACWQQGSRWIDANLFNGEYYMQKVRGVQRDQIAPVLRGAMGSEDTEAPQYQVGEGCLADQLIGQYLADVAGLGPLLDAGHIRKTLAIHLSLQLQAHTCTSHDCVQRTYVLNDEPAPGGLRLRQGRRARAFPSLITPRRGPAWNIPAAR